MQHYLNIKTVYTGDSWPTACKGRILDVNNIFSWPVNGTKYNGTFTIDNIKFNQERMHKCRYSHV